MTRPVVLNTRPREQAAELSAALAEAGFDPVEAPAIEIQPAWDRDELDATRRRLAAQEFDWVVLPSQNAAKALRDDLRAARIIAGVVTARTLGLPVEVEISRFSAGAALEALRALVRPGQRVLVPRVAHGRDELLDGLRALGAEVHAPVAYRTVAVDAAATCLETRRVDAVTFCSPSAVASLLKWLSPARLEGSAVVCLGTTTAEAAREAGLRVDAVASNTSMHALVDAVRVAVRRVVAV